MSRYDFSTPKYRRNKKSVTRSSAPQMKRQCSYSHGRPTCVPRSRDYLQWLKPRANDTAAERIRSRKSAALNRMLRRLEEDRQKVERRRERLERQRQQDELDLRRAREQFENDLRLERKRIDEQEERLMALQYQSERDNFWDRMDEKTLADLDDQKEEQLMYDRLIAGGTAEAMDVDDALEASEPSNPVEGEAGDDDDDNDEDDPLNTWGDDD